MNFPCTPNAFQSGRLGTSDAYYVLFDISGNREYATYYGGSVNEDCFGVAADASGNIYLAGHTSSIDFNVAGIAFQTNFSGVNDAWIARFDSTGVPVFSTFFGGSTDDKTWSMARRDGYLYVVGYTYSADLPINVTAPQDSIGGTRDGFVVKLDTAGNYVTSTFLGGVGVDDVYGVTVNADTMVTCVGVTYSNNLSVTPGAYQQFYVANEDGFVVRYKLSEEWSSSEVQAPVQESGISIFPNPVSGNILSVTSTFDVDEAKIIDMNGKVVKTSCNVYGKFVAFDLQNVASGVYIVDLSGTNGQHATGKLVVE